MDTVPKLHKWGLWRAGFESLDRALLRNAGAARSRLGVGHRAAADDGARGQVPRLRSVGDKLGEGDGSADASVEIAEFDPVPAKPHPQMHRAFPPRIAQFL